MRHLYWLLVEKLSQLSLHVFLLGFDLVKKLGKLRHQRFCLDGFSAVAAGSEFCLLLFCQVNRRSLVVDSTGLSYRCCSHSYLGQIWHVVFILLTSLVHSGSYFLVLYCHSSLD